jgi:hypothetical protein
MNKDVQFTLRLPRDLLAAVEEQAAENERTTSAEIRLLIRRHVEEEASLKAA